MNNYKPLLKAIEINLNNNVLPDKSTINYFMDLYNNNVLSKSDKQKFQLMFKKMQKLLNKKEKEVNKALKKINKDIQKNKEIDIALLDLIMDTSASGLLTQNQDKSFTVLLQKINEVNNLPAKTNSNIFMRIPFVSKIVNSIKMKNFDSKYNEKQQQIKEKTQTEEKLYTQNVKTNQIVPKANIYNPQTIVISDLHGDMDRWNTIRNHLTKYPNTKFIIEGDAMDRGPFGIDILLEIKELSDSGKVQYLPGNHDIFTYNYLKTQNTSHTQIYNNALKHLEHNGGKTTINSLENFDVLVNSAIQKGRLHKSISKQELTDWLGKQPIQTVRHENGINYALAHAVFDTKLYSEDKDFNMEKALNIQTKNSPTQTDIENLKRFNNCMWYREQEPKTHYAPLSWPKDFLVIVGHTKQEETNIQNIEGDPQKQIVYIDCKKGNFQGFNLTKAEHISLEPQRNNQNEYLLEK